MLLSYGVVISLATLGVTVSSIHFIPQGILYDRIVQCAVPNTNTTVRNCATMQIYLDVMTVAQSVVLLSSFSAFMDCCFSFSQRKQEKGKGVADTEKVGNARSSIQFTARRESSAGVRRATRFGSVDETPELDYPPPDKIEEEEITTGNAGPSSIPEAITKQSNEDSSSTRSKIATNTEA
ncbi:hypothetical protein BJ508DRAFT_129254 [Ascobolus immersus RN42]|uniref:Uncharacterized protein n=1 Tax=Ascobolus immersus RN42 TaxID=1160509 RepID=A0A3N4I4L9_ASCIM|nr:hypothetical protein BJ508DRAFT_129254 [Ascobolus immersus RN42]